MRSSCEVNQAKRFFFEKRGKNLLLHLGCGNGGATIPRTQSFFASFCSQKEVLASL